MSRRSEKKAIGGSWRIGASSRFEHIDALRAVAVLLVAISHAGLGSIVPGGAGVTIFFTISGFIITFILLREKERFGRFEVSKFYWKRLLKLGPPLLVLIIIPTFVYSLFAQIDLHAVLGQIFFFYNWVKIAGDANVLPGSGVTWSLAIEEQFYIGFSVFWLFASRTKNYVRVVQALSLIAVVWAVTTRIVLVAFHSSGDRIEFGTDSRLDSIAIGILCATIYSVGSRAKVGPTWSSKVIGSSRSPWVLIGASLLFLAATAVPSDFFRETFRYFLQSAAVGAIILYGMSGPSDSLGRAYVAFCRLRLMQLIGLASYSIYLVHVPLYELMALFPPANGSALFVPIKACLGVAAGVLAWRFIEVPIERYKSRLFSPAARRVSDLQDAKQT